MPGRDNRNVTCAEASWERDFPEPCGRGRGGEWPRRNPGKPTPAQPWEGLDGNRPWDLAPPCCWVLSTAKLFFFFPSLLPFHPRLVSVCFLSPFTWLPTQRVHATTCDDQRSWWSRPFLSGFRVAPRAVRFVSHYSVRSLDSVGT